MELDLIEWLSTRLPVRAGTRIGIGDDAAILASTEGERLVTTDLLADGVHFSLAEHSPQRIGRKALAVNLSDIAAMGARPVAAFVSVLLPRSGGRSLFQEMYEGLLLLADRYGVTIAGGDTCVWDGPLVLDVCAIGAPHARGPLLRSGAEPGDVLLVTGPLGGSLEGKHLDFEPRVREVAALLDRADLHAGMDISDGLAIDLSRLCQASRCGAVLEAAAIPISSAALDAAAREPSGRSPLDRALGDGEDFELLLAAPPSEAQRLLADSSHGVELAAIGEITAGSKLEIRMTDGSRRPLPVTGYEHA